MPAVPIVAVAGLALSAVSAGIGAIGAMNAAKAQSENAQYQAQVAKNNQIIASQNAEYATQAGAAKAEDTAIENKAREGAVTTALAASGLDVNSGTPQSVEETQKETSALGEQRVIDASTLQAYGYRTQASNYGGEAGLQSAEAGQATTAGDLSAGGGLLAGASGVGLNYVKLNQEGALGSSPATGTGGVPAFSADSGEF